LSTIFIKSDINAVLHVVVPFINGGLFDAFEYYANIYDYSKDIYLTLIFDPSFDYNINNINSTTIQAMFSDKYALSADVFDNIIFLKKPSQLIRYKFNKVLILDNHTLYYIKDVLNAQDYYIIIDPFIPSKTNYEQLNKFPNYHLYSELLLYSEDK
jgi:hypothetical protein